MPLIKPEEESALLNALKRAYYQSPFWHQRLSALGYADQDFVPGFPFAELPLLSKADLVADQAERPPFGNLMSVSADDVRRIHKTSGTTSTPLYIALTDRDVKDTYMTAKRAFGAAGMGPGDRVVHCLNFNMWSGGVTDYMPIEELGATGVPFGVGNTLLLVHVIRTLGINAISSTPSYMFVLADKCRQELGIDPRELGLKKGYFGGENLLQVPGIRDEIEQVFGMTAFDANYGMSEVLSVIAGESAERNGLVYGAHGVLYAEVIDGDERPQDIEPGVEGELVFSTLRREGQPLFRYRTNDLAKILWAEPGEDYLTRMRFHIVGRSDDMLVHKGVNFFPQSLLSVLAEFNGRIGRNFRVVRPPSAKAESLECVFETSLPDGPQRESLEREIADKVAAMLQIRIRVSWLPEGTIPLGANKARYLIDHVDDILNPPG